MNYDKETESLIFLEGFRSQPSYRSLIEALYTLNSPPAVSSSKPCSSDSCALIVKFKSCTPSSRLTVGLKETTGGEFRVI